MIIRSLLSILLLSTLVSTQSTVNAAVIYDENVLGDTGGWFSSSYKELDKVTSGDTVHGNIDALSAHGDYWDGWSFQYTGQVDSITIRLTSGNAQNGWQIYDADDSSSPLDSGYLDTDFGVQAINFNLSTLGFGEYLLGNANNSFGTLYSYEIVFSSESVPEPTIIGLFGVGLVGLSVIRRRKKYLCPTH